MKFYIAIGAAGERLAALHTEQLQMEKNRKRFRQRFGATGVVVHGDDCVGLVFANDVHKDWRQSKRLAKHVAGACVPRLLALKIELRGLRSPVNMYSVSDAVGVDAIIPPRFTIAQSQILCGKIIVALDDRARPKNCRRISDVEYETLLQRHKGPRTARVAKR